MIKVVHNYFYVDLKANKGFFERTFGPHGSRRITRKKTHAHVCVLVGQSSSHRFLNQPKNPVS
jgi:hypothetical protein